MARTQLQGRNSTVRQRPVAQRIAMLVSLAEQLHHNEPDTALAYAGAAHELASASGDRTALASALYAMGECHTVGSDYDAAVRCFREAIELYSAPADDDARHRVMSSLATVYERTSRYKESLQLLATCLGYWQGRDDGREDCIRILNSLGIIYKNIDDFGKALGYYVQCLQLLGEEESLRTAKVLLNIGNVYVRELNAAKAFEYYRRAQSIGISIGDSYVQHVVLLNFANACIAQKDYECALQYYNEALETAGKYGVETKLTILTGMGEIYTATEDFSRALAIYTEVAALAEQAGILRRQVYSLGSIGSILRLQGEPERAVEVLQQALALAEEAGLLYHQYHLYKFLATAYENCGDIPQAYEYYKQYTELREKMVDEEKQKALAEMQTRFEVERVEQQNEIYRLRTRQLEQELSLRSNELSALVLRLTEKNDLLQAMRSEIVRHRGAAGTGGEKLMAKLLSWIENNLNAEAAWAAFEQQFNQIHHGFIQKLSERCPRLTTTELRVCSLLKVQLASKDIARLLSLSPRTVETHRYNIRKKLQLDTPAHLATFLSSL